MKPDTSLAEALRRSQRIVYPTNQMNQWRHVQVQQLWAYASATGDYFVEHGPWGYVSGPLGNCHHVTEPCSHLACKTAATSGEER